MKKSYLLLLPLTIVFLICGGSTCADDLARMTPTNDLHFAASNNDLDGIDRALNRGYSIELRDDRQNTALHFAAFYGKVDAAKRLLERGANPNAQDMSGRSPLHLASPESNESMFYRRYAETMEVLLNYGAQINATDGFGDTPLHRAAYWVVPENVELLVRWGADRSIRNYERQTAFDVASDKIRSEGNWLQNCRQMHKNCSLDRFNRLSEILRLLN
jgi:ankyrin repeat protein